jgi:hypothetical protein
MRAQIFALCFTSEKNLKDAYTGARARPCAHARAQMQDGAQSQTIKKFEHKKP